VSHYELNLLEENFIIFRESKDGRCIHSPLIIIFEIFSFPITSQSRIIKKLIYQKGQRVILLGLHFLSKIIFFLSFI